VRDCRWRSGVGFMSTPLCRSPTSLQCTAPPAGHAGGPFPTQLSQARRVLRTAGMGHEDAFPRPGPNGRCRFGQETFAGVRSNGRDAPIPVGSGPGWAAPPDPTPSDSLGNTAGGTYALSKNTVGGYNTASALGDSMKTTRDLGIPPAVMDRSPSTPQAFTTPQAASTHSLRTPRA
jgi:hypothetical protein